MLAFGCLQAAGDLLARHVAGGSLPQAYAAACHPERLARVTSDGSTVPRSITNSF